MVTIKVKKLRPDAIVPRYAHPSDAGLDLHATEDYALKAGERHLFRLGIATEIPEGYFGYVRDKSGLALRAGLTVLGGVIDEGYRGEYGIILLNTGREPYEVHRGDKIAQLLIQPVVHAEIAEVSDLSDTDRGAGGFGSTGK